MTAVTIGSSQYCQLCGSRVTTPGAVAAATPAKTPARSMDIRRGPQAKPAASPAPAAQLHGRTNPPAARSMDLRRSPAAGVQVATGTVLTSQRRGAVHVPDHGFSQPKSKLDTSATPQLHEAPKPTAQTTRTRPRFGGPPRMAHFEDRFKRAQSVPKSEYVSKFSPATSAPTVASAAPAMTPTHPLAAGGSNISMHMPSSAVTAHQSMNRLAPASTATPPPASLRWGQYAGLAAAVAIMSGYIWLQNAPKMAVQAAAAKAGVAATTPTYVPTSYNLASTAAAPGVLTLNFKSPSEASQLAISQQRTTWDAKSLADNFVASADPAYTVSSGQGLTIYLFGKNNAAWVNHGVWYTIKGTATLSRDQVLKIAYGL